MFRLILIILIILTNKIFPQWAWYNPYPTPYKLLDIQFIDAQNGFLISDHNEFFTTADGGQSWQYHKINEQGSLLGLSFMNIDIGYLCGTNGLILKTTNGGESWTPRNSGIEADINSIQIVNDEYSFAAADSGIFLYTTNGGLHWHTKVISDKPNNDLNDVYFTNKDSGVVTQTNYIFRTTDGGISWLYHEIPNHWFKIYFPNDSVGFISGSEGMVLKTTNVGETWIEIQTPVNDWLRTLQFVNDTTGFFFGTEGVKTTDGGETWIKLANINPFTTINSQYFFDESNGMIVGTGGRIFTTNNGGNSWKIFHQGIESTIHHLTFIDDTTAFFVLGTSSLAKSSDYFKTWDVKLTVPTNMVGLSFPEKPYGYVIGSAQVFKTTDNGENWFFTADLEGAFDVDFATPSLGICVGDMRKIWKTSDGGYNWQQVNTLSNFYLTSVDMIDTLYGCAVGIVSMTYFTLNGGESWFLVDLYPPEVQFMKVKFYQRTLGIACAYYGQIYKSISGGASWYAKQSPVQTRLRDIYFVNEDSIYIVGDEGVILLSTDSGETWTLQESPTNKDLYSIYFPKPNLGFITGANGTILIKNDIPTSVDNPEEKNSLPEEFILYQNYPNPFNPSTKIKFKIPLKSPSPYEGEGFRVRLTTLTVYNVLGQKVTTLINKELPPGEYEVEFNGSGLPSGIYFYKLATGSSVQVRKMVFVK